MGSLVGYEQGGRRRRVVLATDRRIVIAPTRPAPPLEISYEELSDVSGADGTLALVAQDGERTLVERIADETALHLVVDLLRGHAGVPAGHHAPRPPKVRIVSA